MKSPRGNVRGSLILLGLVSVFGQSLPAYSQSSDPFAGKPLRVIMPGQTRNLTTFRGLSLALPKFRPLPASAVHKDTERNLGIQAANDSILYTQRINTRASNGLANTQNWDYLWGFPTLGLDLANKIDFTSIFPNTLIDTAPAYANIAHIQLGQIGIPAMITRLRIGGSLFPLNANGSLGAEVGGRIGFFILDGVDFANPTGTDPLLPSLAKIAKTNDGGDAAFYFELSTPAAGGSNFGTYSFDFSAGVSDPRILIDDPQGRFGILIGRITKTLADGVTPDPTDPPANVEWMGIIGVATGPNLVYSLTNGSFDGMTLATGFTGTDFNQGNFSPNPGNPLVNDTSQNTPPLNYYLALQGRKQDNSFPLRGNLEGNVRLRGVDVPADKALEAAPHLLRFDFFESTPAGQAPGALLRTHYLYTQPSYNANGTLTKNFRIDGLDARTYDVLITNLDILGLDASNNILSNSLWDTSRYPFSDFLPTLLKGVKVDNQVLPTSTSSGLATALAAPVRLEHFADVDDGSDTGTPDGVVGLEDLVYFFNAYGSADGDPNFQAIADLVGGVDDTTNPAGLPDGVIELEDLIAFFTEYGQGNPEP